MWNEVDSCLKELIMAQKNELLSTGRRIVPEVTADDLLQPNDFPDLENHPEFRYEEGVLAGMETVRYALRALEKELV
ncbi:MAG: hypothetical protein H7A37_09230 [Chlamydiales bacterium]|nr:hypothetical protein [Chlamydiia bacterium]MCP5508459.1 hypothetical protein [Chlamydiales bacterium]